MTLRGGTPIYFPANNGGKPVCDSHDVMATFELEQVAAEFMHLSSRERRQWLCSSRNPHSIQDHRHLYKYQALDWEVETSVHKARSLLVYNRIWAAAPGTLNDPNDMRFVPVLSSDPVVRRRWTQSHMELLAHLPPVQRLQRKRQLERLKVTPAMAANLQQVVNENTGVFSASPSPRERLMWSHYADAHKGFCVQFAPYEDALFLVAKPMVYGNQFPTVNIPSKPVTQDEHYLIKSTDWSYEREWRVVLPLNDCAVQLRPAAVSGVIFGAMAKPETIKTVLNLLKERQQLGNPPVKVYKAQLLASSHEIKIVGFKHTGNMQTSLCSLKTSTPPRR